MHLKVDGRTVALQRQKGPMNERDRANILMVDDQAGKLLSYEVILSELGENLIKARSAREAMEQLLRNDIAVVLMDVSMPDINGFELADMMHRHPRFQKTAIIFISAVHLSDPDRIKGYQSGAVDYISVPVVPELLRAKVSVFTELHRKTRQLEELNRELEQRVQERTEQLRHSEEQLQQRLAELETIMQVLPVGVAVSQDPGCEVITGNAALNQILGADMGENISLAGGESDKRSFRMYQDGRELKGKELPLPRAVATGQQLGSVEIEVRHDNGSITHLLASASPLRDAAGAVRGAVGAFFDVSSRKQMEDLLRERADLLELATEAVLVRDLNGLLTFWNSGAEELYGWRREEVLGKPIHDILKTRFPLCDEEIEESLTETGSWEGNLTQTTHSGRELIVASRLAVKAGGNAILEINRDITAQLQAEDALRKAERLAAMGRVAGIIAHEINNPLEAISNTFFLLRDHPSLDAEARHYAQMGEEEMLRLSHITRQTLGFYRESKHPVEVSIAQLLDDILELQLRRLEFNKIAIIKRYSSRGIVQGFPVELKQVFLNLIGNAVQAMPEGGQLRLHVFDSMRRKDRQAGTRISICDTGVGIDTEHSRHLFEPFFTTKAAKGTGLGLWISKGIIQKYGGSITFRSIRGDNRNVTCFHIFLPHADLGSSGHAAAGPELLKVGDTPGRAARRA
jgi:PAS domain S-box-containing protein